MGTRGSSEEKGQLFTYIIKKPQEDLTIEIRGGDGRLRDLYLDVVDLHRWQKSDCKLLSDYIGGKPRPLAATRLGEVPAGSTLSITAESSKPLSKATIRSISSIGTKSISPDTQAASVQTQEKFIVQNSRLIYPKHRNKKVLSTSNHDASPELLARSLTTPSWASNSQIQLVSQTKNPFVSRTVSAGSATRKLKSRLMASRRSSQHLHDSDYWQN